MSSNTKWCDTCRRWDRDSGPRGQGWCAEHEVYRMPGWTCLRWQGLPDDSPDPWEDLGDEAPAERAAIAERLFAWLRMRGSDPRLEPRVADRSRGVGLCWYGGRSDPKPADGGPWTQHGGTEECSGCAYYGVHAGWCQVHERGVGLHDCCEKYLGKRLELWVPYTVGGVGALRRADRLVRALQAWRAYPSGANADALLAALREVEA